MFGNTSIKHDPVPDVLRPLSGLQTGGVNEGGSTGPFVRDLPAFGDRRVTTRWGTAERCHRYVALVDEGKPTPYRSLLNIGKSRGQQLLNAHPRHSGDSKLASDMAGAGR